LTQSCQSRSQTGPDADKKDNAPTGLSYLPSLPFDQNASHSSRTPFKCGHVGDILLVCPVCVTRSSTKTHPLWPAILPHETAICSTGNHQSCQGCAASKIIWILDRPNIGYFFDIGIFPISPAGTTVLLRTRYRDILDVPISGVSLYRLPWS
jgi:hypothetical protein